MPGGERGTSLTLLQRARSKDQEAWQRLVQLYAPLGYSWCNRGGVRAEDADDLVQEVFQAAAAAGLDSFRRDRPGDTFRGWLRGITRNLVALYHRRQGRQPRAPGGTDALRRLQEIPADAPAMPDDADDPPAELRGLYHRALELVRGEFEKRTWRMFWLTVVEGRSPVDIAAELGVTPAAVRKAKSRVLHRLKQEVGDLIQ
jgi:RNA polymerase sigma-70 factor, ECF subfamily